MRPYAGCKSSRRGGWTLTSGPSEARPLFEAPSLTGALPLTSCTPFMVMVLFVDDVEMRL
jgi:hypothetical protein